MSLDYYWPAMDSLVMDATHKSILFQLIKPHTLKNESCDKLIFDICIGNSKSQLEILDNAFPTMQHMRFIYNSILVHFCGILIIKNRILMFVLETVNLGFYETTQFQKQFLSIWTRDFQLRIKPLPQMHTSAKVCACSMHMICANFPAPLGEPKKKMTKEIIATN